MFYLPFYASKTKCFSFKSGCVMWNENSDMRHQLQPKKKAVLAFNIAAKDVYVPFNASKTKCFSFKSGCVMWEDMHRQLQPNKTKIRLY